MSFASVFSRFRPVPRHRGPARTARPAVAFRSLILGSALLLPGALRAQSPGSFDSNLGPELYDSTVFAAAIVYVQTSTSLTPVERILAGGDITSLTVDDANGSLLTSFQNPFFGGAGRVIYTIVPDFADTGDPANPLFYLGGLFGKTANNKNSAAQNITRMTLAGVIDSTFNPGTGADAYVTSILPLNDAAHTIVVGGLFNSFDKKAYPHVVRLTNTGAISPGFASVPVNDGVFAVAPQVDPTLGTPDPGAPQFLIGGTFTAIGNTNYSKLARINYNGSVDASFKPVIDERVLAIATQPDGKVVIGGQFGVVNGQAVGHLARLNQDGSLDKTFNASVGVSPEGIVSPIAVYTLKLLPDGRIYVGGNFYAVDGASRRYLARINTDGSLDTSFDPGHAVTESVQVIAVQADNKVIVGETVNKKINNVFPPSFIRLHGDPTTTLSEISLSATKPNAVVGTTATRKPGVFELIRTGGNTNVPLTVYFSTSGSAQARSAYKPLAVGQYGGGISQLTFPAGVNVLHIKVKPLNNTLSDGSEAVTLTLLPSPNPSALYGPATPVASTVTIRNP